MARIPDGARLLIREGGWVPAIAVDVDGGCIDGGATVIVLPGVPSELRAIVAQVVEPTFLAGRNRMPSVVELEHAFPESALNPVFAAVLTSYPDVKLGSYPGRPMVVRLSGTSEDVEAASAMVRQELERLGRGTTGDRLAAAWSRRRADPTSEPSQQDV